MVTGSFVRQGPQLHVTMRASDVETGIVASTADGAGPVSQPGVLIGSLYRRLAGDLGRRLPELAPHQIDEAPLSNLHFMKGLGHYHSARYSHALAEFMLAAEDGRLTDISRLWLAKAYLAQRKYSHACLELTRLMNSAPTAVAGTRRDREHARMRATCESRGPEDDSQPRRAAGSDFEMNRPMRSKMDGKATLAGAVLLAAVAGHPTVSAQPLASVVLVAPRLHPGEPYRFIGGRTVTVPLTVHGPKPDGLAVRAQLVQLSSSLAVPIAGEFDVPLAVSAAGCRHLRVGARTVPVSPGREPGDRFRAPVPIVLAFRSSRVGSRADCVTGVPGQSARARSCVGGVARSSAGGQSRFADGAFPGAAHRRDERVRTLRPRAVCRIPLAGRNRR